MCAWDASSHSPSPFLKDEKAVLLHFGWALFDSVLTLWIVWACSTKERGGAEAILRWVSRGGASKAWLVLSPIISAVISSVPTTLWWGSEVSVLVLTFLFLCGLC
jgi:hypothetical protein